MLGGEGFEKLCFQLLVNDGKSPRFFGKSGQPDYGADIISEEGDSRTIYQCKNLRAMPSVAPIEKTVEKFEKEWLNQMELPKPIAYVFCCPHHLKDVNDNVEWTLFKDEFRTFHRDAAFGHDETGPG